MSRMRTVIAVLGMAAIACLMPLAQAQTVKVLLSGSSAMWQTLALGAYNSNGTNGQCIAASGATAPCFHYTSGSNFNLTDTRPATPITDTGAIWIVWDSTPAASGGPFVWAYMKVDSVVGVRCFFAQPHCTVSVPSFPGVGNSISSAVWGDGSADQAPPASVQALFTNGRAVTGAATDIRPEDALFATCRANSQLGNGNSGSGDGLDGLGYGQKSSGVCPVLADAGNTKVGTPIQSGKPGSTAKANVVAFNISGKDPISGTTIPTAVTTSVGAAPIVFLVRRAGALANLNNATEPQLQKVFSGTRCNADVFGLASASIQAYLREPMSGTMNTTEATTFRRPTVPASGGTLGLSQETGVNPTGGDNPLSQACNAGGGSRFRAIGTGEEVNSVRDSGTDHGTDGIGYAFFSYGNVSGIANNANYGYITVNGIDPIFATYGGFDPGQPATAGTIPAAANLPANCQPSGFPCSEHDIWAGGFSFPNLRAGLYRQWSVLRVISGGTANTALTQLVTNSQKYVVNNTPDYVPFKAVAGTTDLGLKLVRSHYQQKDGDGNNIGAAPVNTGTDKGGDMGGCILPTAVGVTISAQKQLIQNATDDSLGCVKR